MPCASRDGRRGPPLRLTAVILPCRRSSTAGSPRSTVPCTSSCSINVGQNRSHFYTFQRYSQCPGLGPTSLLGRVHASVLGTHVGPPGSTRVPHPCPGPRAGPSDPGGRRHMPAGLCHGDLRIPSVQRPFPWAPSSAGTTSPLCPQGRRSLGGDPDASLTGHPDLSNTRPKRVPGPQRPSVLTATQVASSPAQTPATPQPSISPPAWPLGNSLFSGSQGGF